MLAWPFHRGELEAQARAGGGSSGGAIRAHMPDQHRAFFEALPFAVVASTGASTGASVDASTGRSGDALAAASTGSSTVASTRSSSAMSISDSIGDSIGDLRVPSSGASTAGRWPLATIWSGAPGFITAPDPRTLRFAGPLDPADPATAAFVVGAPFGLLGIELATRRRNRANGVITSVDPGGVTVAIGQSFGNCPQYIQPRDIWRVAPAEPNTEPINGLDRAATAAIAAADTFFIATAAYTEEPTGGVDVSHRGGPPGFVRVDGDVLTIPDYRGNRYFNTLGNLVSEPRAALVFVDFARGDLLHLHGTVEIQWDGPEVRALPGAERLWRVRVEHGWRRRGALALRWTRQLSAAS